MTVVLRRILDRPAGTRRPTVHVVNVGTARVRLVHHYAVTAEAVEDIVDGELRRTGAPSLAIGTLLPDLFVADAPGWHVGVAVAHRSWAVPLSHLRADGSSNPATSAVTEVDVVGSWCRSQAAARLARAAGTTPDHVELYPVGDGLVVGLAVARSRSRALATAVGT